MRKPRPKRPIDEWWRQRLPAPNTLSAQPVGFAGVRLSLEAAEASLEQAAERLALPPAGAGDDVLDVLVISGGAAGGAHGAGVLVGLTAAGKRPAFGIVTGVSTGGLIAPFAFLGPAWDDRLKDAYTGGHAHELFALPAFSGLLDGGVLSAESLDQLIAPFVDAEMLEAIAAEHRRGRRLLVATTDLDSQSPAIWDMGEIACRGGDAALDMFRLVLAASASLPGVFPPRLIRCEADGVEYEELHVDGGLIAPLFLFPESLLHWRRIGPRLARGRVYALVNTAIDIAPQTTRMTLPSVLVRSFDTMLRVSYRQALNVVTTFCVANNIPLSVAALPASRATLAEGAMLDFGTENMRASFAAGYEAASSDTLWRSPVVCADQSKAGVEAARL